MRTVLTIVFVVTLSKLALGQEYGTVNEYRQRTAGQRAIAAGRRPQPGRVVGPASAFSPDSPPPESWLAEIINSGELSVRAGKVGSTEEYADYALWHRFQKVNYLYRQRSKLKQQLEDRFYSGYPRDRVKQGLLARQGRRLTAAEAREARKDLLAHINEINLETIDWMKPRTVYDPHPKGAGISRMHFDPEREDLFTLKSYARDWTKISGEKFNGVLALIEDRYIVILDSKDKATKISRSGISKADQEYVKQQAALLLPPQLR
jgi:hypothetical protein